MVHVVSILICLFITDALCLERNVPRSCPKHPLILVPGDGGSQAFAKLKVNGGDPFLLWVNLWYFLRPGTLAEYMSPLYDPTTSTVTDNDLAHVLFPGWGDTSSIENLDTTAHTGTSYFGDLVSAVRKDAFFISNKTLRGAPFDFRRAPNENPLFNYMMKNLIEETYGNSGNCPVVLLGHSLGALYSLAFLNTVTDRWKRTHIKAFLAISGPLGGSVKAMKIMASGDNFGIPVRQSLSFRPLQRSLPSTAYLFPDQRLWPPEEVLIVTPTTNYSAHDYERFFHDINHTVGYQQLLETKRSVDGFVGPTGINELYCIYGTNISTIYQMSYAPANIFHNAFPDQDPMITYGDGDGTVHTRSLEVCKRWPGAKHIILAGAEHLRIVGDPRLIDFVRNIIGAEFPTWS